MQFCKKFETKYGQLEVTPNIHLHSHLINCVVDYGPVHNFWLFSFERFNGVLGDFKTNQRAVEIQLMRKFLWDQDIRNLPFQSLIKDQLGPVFSQMTCVQSNKEFTILVLRWNTYPCHMVQLQRQIFGLTLHHFLVYLHTEWIILMIMNWTVLCINSQHFLKELNSEVEVPYLTATQGLNF